MLPETLVWYALMPAFVRGVVYAMRHRFRAVLPILVFAASLTGAYALMQGNVGTAYRQRTQVTMFFFIFMAVGIVENVASGGGADGSVLAGLLLPPVTAILDYFVAFLLAGVSMRSSSRAWGQGPTPTAVSRADVRRGRWRFVSSWPSS